MSAFQHYARYYDLVYGAKDYTQEIRFVAALFRRHNLALSRVLELGCGTGRHAAELANMGVQVHGVDLSAEMIAMAMDRKRKLTALFHPPTFSVADIRTTRTGATYDAVFSLFHVASYQLQYSDLEAMLATAAAHLSIGGGLFFDFWYGPAVLSDPPLVKVKRLEDDQIRVTRTAEPESLSSENRVTVHYRVLVCEKLTSKTTEVVEKHELRYWFLPELQYFLHRAGFDFIEAGRCYTADPLSTTSWYGWILAKRATN